MSINRIRLEFKGYWIVTFWFSITVLIESDWNLKMPCIQTLRPPALVLIESDWNLKDHRDSNGTPKGSRINRIRLEFKVIPGIF